MLVLSRLAGCDAPTQRLVEAMSVLGVSAPLWRAARLAGLADPVAALDQAVAAHLLVERSTDHGIVVAFPHPLVQAAVYQDLGPARRTSLHGGAAELADDELARLNHRLHSTGHPDDTLVAELAAFARREAGAGLWSSAAVHLTRAARLATAEDEQVRLTADARVQARMVRARRRGDRDAVRQLRKQLRRLPSVDPQDPRYRRLQRAEVEVHHVRKLADLTRPGRPQPAWAQLMVKRRRKTLVVCQPCHAAIHTRKPTAAPTE
ncbi:HNH endonuclease [Sphaerisporangium perillae]|uniref:HNH endonuclease n=1 Tax=Sphaerisporangium perillae TaxID=2935860 RepID=UPI00200F5B93|nr:hypothetical protein [Sphaerisporangium perillae]